MEKYIQWDENDDLIIFSRSKKIIAGSLAFLVLCIFVISQSYPEFFSSAIIFSRWPGDTFRLGLSSRQGPVTSPSYDPRNRDSEDWSSGGIKRRKRQETGGVFPLHGPSCRPPVSLHNLTSRVTLLHEVTIRAYPSLGGMIVLERPEAMDFEFLGLDPLDPTLLRLDDQVKEDLFSKRLLLLGAMWWESPGRRIAVKEAEDADSNAYLSMEIDEIPRPSLRERRWVVVAWPSTGGFWVSEFDTSLVYGLDHEKDNMLPFDTGRMRLARTMDERTALMRKHFAPKYYEELEDYNGLGYLNVWENRFSVVQGGIGSSTSD